MATQKLNLTRDQLSLFLQNFEQIKQFERLFALADQISPSPDTPGTEILAGTGAASANEALAQIVVLAKDAAINSGNADQKAVQALDSLGRIANSLELLANAPVIQNNNSTKTDYVDYDINAPFVNQIARTGWNVSDQTLNLGMDYDVTQQVGQETYARVRNSTGSTIPNGTAVGFVGASTDALSVAPYLADGSSPSLYILGIMTHDLPDSGEKGYCTTFGFVRDLDTSAFSVGDILYPSPSVAGELTNVKPTAPNNVIPIAAVITSDATTGVIFVRPTITQMQYYGIFAKTADTSPAAINTAYPITFDTTRLSNGVIIGGTASQIIVPQSGLYQFSATVQLTSGNTSSKNVWVWFRKNGVDIPSSARLVTININGGYVPIALNEAVSLAANGYVELVYAANDTNVTVDNVPATAFAPAAPAVVLEVTQVQQ
jgi:hypothetical protein